MRHRAQAAPERHPDHQLCADSLGFPILVVTLVTLKRIPKVKKNQIKE